RRLAGAWRAPEDHRVRLSGLEGEPQRLAGTDEVRLADDIVERLRAERLGERRGRARVPEQVGHFSPSTSAPFGRPKREAAGAALGLRWRFAKRRTVVGPKWSVSSIAWMPATPNPMRMRSKPASFSFGVASSHSRPPCSPASLRSKAFSTSLEPARSAAGV